ncbi:MAG: glycosyltransferase family 4 protein [Sulfuricaulis sp.]
MRIIYHHRTQGEEPESIHIAAIVQALRDLGHEVLLVGPDATHRSGAPGRSSLLVKIKRSVPGFVFEFLQLAYNIVVYGKLHSAVKRFRPDLIYERYALYNFAGMLLARRRRIPSILEVNTPYAHAWAKYYGLKFRRLAEAIELRILSAAGHVVTVTHAQKHFLEKCGIPSSSMDVLHNAIDPKEFDPERFPVSRTELGFTARHTVVGFVGTMNRWQGIPEFPQVIRAVLRAHDDARFLFVGDGEHRAALEAFCVAEGFKGKVLFVGRQAHARIPALVAAMDIAVLLNSNSYGSPMKIFEYLAMKKAVIAPRVGPVEEIIADAGTGFLIEPGNAEQMAEKIVLLAGDPELRRRLGEAGRRYVLTHHTWKENAARIVAIYHSLSNPGNPRQ